MKRLIPLALLAILAFAGTARGQAYYYSQPVTNTSGLPVPGAQVAVCTTLATTAAAVANDIATLTMASNPITAGYTAGGTISVSGFTSSDTYFNGSWQVLTVSSVAITYALTHANASAGTNGIVVEAGTQTTACAPLATIYVDQTATTDAPNPFTADGFGNFSFWSTSGQYFGFVYGPNVGPYLFPITSPVVSGGSSGSCPAGSNTQVQFNGAGSCAAASGFTYSGGTLSVPTVAIATGGSLAGTFTGTPTFSGNLTFSGAPNFGSGAALTGTFSGTPTFSGNLTFSGNPSFTGNPAFSGTPNFTTPYTESGSGSGTVTFACQTACGTYNWNWPTTAGTLGQVLTAGGGGSNPMTWSTPSIFNPGTTTGDTFYCTNTSTPCTTGRLGIGSTGAVYQVVGGIPSWNTKGINVRGISFTIGVPGGTLTAGGSTTDYVTVPFACTIAGYDLAIDTGTITVKFWKVGTGTAIPTSSNSISTSGVGIASGTAIHSTTLTDFTTTTVTADDIVAMNVSAVSSAGYINGVLECTQ